jgi:hypothetical protein
MRTIQAALWLSERRRQRREVARAAWHYRSLLREIDALSPGVLDRFDWNMIVRTAAVRHVYGEWADAGHWFRVLCLRVDRRRLRREYRDLRDWCTMPCPDFTLDDGYARCGEEDAWIDRRHQARKELALYRWAMHLLGHQGESRKAVAA